MRMATEMFKSQRLCRNSEYIDVSEVENIQLGDEVILLGRDGMNQITADDMAQQLGTIGYEIVCCIGKRVPRVYM